MRSSHKAITATLLAGAVAGWMTACSKDAATAPGDGANAVGVNPTATAQGAPANDGFGRAKVIASLPFSDNVDISLATTAPDDPVNDDTCGFGPVVGNTVWYRFSPTKNVRVNVSTLGSDSDPNTFVYTGKRGKLTRIACNFLPESMTFDARAGETYFILAGSSDGEPAGNLVLRVDLGVEVSIKINPEGVVNARTGVAIIRGKVTCSQPSFWEMGGTVQQQQGDVLVTGALFNDSFQCDGVTPWRAVVFADEGRFVRGRVKISAGALFTSEVTTEERLADTEATVRLEPR